VRWGRARRRTHPQSARLTVARQVDVDDLVTRARRGEPRAVARLISLIEDDAPQLQEVARQVAPASGSAHVIGLTGSPGVGKSTTTSELVTAMRSEGKKVGVLAVDPSSPFTGGALLGDRIRMQDHATDDGVFIRSMATRGHLGGLAAAAPQAVRVLDAAGCDVVLVETVGVGQSEVEVAALADTTVVLLAPGMGDAIQAAKAGILEIGDVFCVNKADRDGADTTARELRGMISLGRSAHSQDRDGSPEPSWRPPIVKTVASRGEGIDELAEELRNHHQWMSEHDLLKQRRITRAAAEIEALVLRTIRLQLSGAHGPRLRQVAEQVVSGELDPFSAAALLS